MIEAIDDPVALALVQWLPADEGGRKSGPPSVSVYSATTVFKLGNDLEVIPGWPAKGNHLSILLERTGESNDGGELVKVGFLVPDLALPFVHLGAELLIMEGPKVVAIATICEVL